MNLDWAMFDSVTQNMSALLAYLQDTILETKIVKKKKKSFYWYGSHNKKMKAFYSI